MFGIGGCLAVVTAMILAGCTVPSAQAGGAVVQCPANGLLQISLLDISASGRDKTILAERLNAMQVDAEVAADCDGEFVAMAWAGSSASSRVLYAGRLATQGATEIGRDRKIPELVRGVMGEIKGELETALREITPDSSDLLGSFYLVADVVQSRSSGTASPVAHIYTDAISTGGSARINEPWVTQKELDTIVAAQTLPALDGTTIDIYGVGRVAGSTPPPQDYIQLVQDYARQLCNRTGAECALYTTVVAY